MQNHKFWNKCWKSSYPYLYPLEKENTKTENQAVSSTKEFWLSTTAINDHLAGQSAEIMAARLLPWKVVIEDRHDSPGNATKLLQYPISAAIKAAHWVQYKALNKLHNFATDRQEPLRSDQNFYSPYHAKRRVFTVHEFWFHATSTVSQA